MRRALALFNWNAGLRLWYDGVAGISGFVFVGFALALGVEKEKMGYLASAASLACIGQVIGILIANVVRDKKRYIMLLCLLDPLLFIATLIAVWYVPLSLRFPVLLLGVLLCAAVLQSASPLVAEWVASTIPTSLRGRYMGRRMQIFGAVAVTATLLIGIATQHLKVFGIPGYLGILLVGAVLGMLAVRPLRNIPLPAVSANARVDWSALPQVLRTAPFLRLLVGTVLFFLPFWMVAPYYQVYNLKILGLNEQTISWMMVGYYLLKIVLSPLAGQWVDRLGARVVIWLTSPIYIIFFVLYVISTPATWWLVMAAWTLVGVADALLTIAFNVSLFHVVPDTPARPAYFAFYNISVVLCAAVCAAVAAAIVSALARTTVISSPLHLGQFQLFFAIVLVVLLPCLLSTWLFPGKNLAQSQ